MATKNFDVHVEGGWQGDDVRIRCSDPTNGRVIATLLIPEATFVNVLRNRVASDMPLADLVLHGKSIVEYGNLKQTSCITIADAILRGDEWREHVDQQIPAGWTTKLDRERNFKQAKDGKYSLRIERYVPEGTPKEVEGHPSAAVAEHKRG